MFKKGQIINFKNYSTIYGKLIALGNLIRYRQLGFTHSAIIYAIGNDIVIAEALSKGFILNNYKSSNLEALIKQNKANLGESKIKLANIQENTNKYVGLPYSWIDIFKCIGWIIFGHNIFKWSETTKQLICSEAVARILYDSSNHKINFEKEFKKSYDLITPTDLFKSKFIKW